MTEEGLVTMQVGFDFAVGDKIIDFLPHKPVLNKKTPLKSSDLFLKDAFPYP